MSDRHELEVVGVLVLVAVVLWAIVALELWTVLRP